MIESVRWRAGRPRPATTLPDARFSVKIVPCSKTVVAGEVAEWLMAPVLKTGIPERVSGVRIPPSPPYSLGCRDFWLPSAGENHVQVQTSAVALSFPRIDFPGERAVRPHRPPADRRRRR